MSDQHTTRCECWGSSTHGNDDPGISLCDLCGGTIPTDPATGEFISSTASPELLGLLREIYAKADIANWWRAPQVMFEGALPPDMVAAGREADLVLALRRLVDGGSV